MRARILAFLAILMLDAAFVRTQPWPVIIGCVAYFVFVFPTLGRRG